MHTFLWICIAVSAILFLISFVRQLYRFRHGSRVQPSRFGVFFNWLFVIVFVGSLAGLAWDEFHVHKSTNASTAASSSSSSTVTHHANSQYSKVSWRPQDLKLGDNGKAPATFKIPAETTVKIIGARTKHVYKTFKAKDHDRQVKYQFEYAARYEIEIIDKHGHHKKRTLTVKDNESSSSSISSSSASVVSSSSPSTATPASAGANNAGAGTGTSTGISQSNNPSSSTTPAQSSSTPQAGGSVGQ